MCEVWLKTKQEPAKAEWEGQDKHVSQQFMWLGDKERRCRDSNFVPFWDKNDPGQN